MGKKKSKSQKQRKKIQKKRKSLQHVNGQIFDREDIIYNVALTNPDIFKDIKNKEQNKEQKVSNNVKKGTNKNNVPKDSVTNLVVVKNNKQNKKNINKKNVKVENKEIVKEVPKQSMQVFIKPQKIKDTFKIELPKTKFEALQAKKKKDLVQEDLFNDLDRLNVKEKQKVSKKLEKAVITVDKDKKDSTLKKEVKTASKFTFSSLVVAIKLKLEEAKKKRELKKISKEINKSLVEKNKKQETKKVDETEETVLDVLPKEEFSSLDTRVEVKKVPIVEKVEDEDDEDRPVIKHPILHFINTIISLFFSCVLVLSFVVLIVGAIRVDIFTKKQIIFAASLLGFLILVALSYSRYFSGKLFIALLVAGMGFCTYKLQYTYDFVHNLNAREYEYKTYYLVGFDTVQNINVYSVNSKNVGLLNNNTINIERKLNTTLNSVQYVEFETEDQLFNALYTSQVRALILTENQYKFLQFDCRLHSDKNVKVLYEFKANAHR